MEDANFLNFEGNNEDEEDELVVETSVCNVYASDVEDLAIRS
jgi:hypothetical protein